MKLKFIFIGKKNSEGINTIINKYLKRLNVYVNTDFVFLSERIYLKSEIVFLNSLKKQDFLIVLDEKGKVFSSRGYSKFLQLKMQHFSSIVFVVGGSYGLSESVIKKANFSISLSQMTFPHLIARLILIEQTYRAFTIINQHPYHHA